MRTVLDITRILAAASIQEQQLFPSAHPKVQRQFKSGNYFVQHIWRCGDNSRAATIRGWRL